MNLHTATFLFYSFFHSLLWSWTIADGAAAALIVFITKASAFCFFNPEQCGITQPVEAMLVKSENKHTVTEKQISVALSDCRNPKVCACMLREECSGKWCYNLGFPKRLINNIYKIILNLIVWSCFHLAVCLACVAST